MYVWCVGSVSLLLYVGLFGGDGSREQTVGIDEGTGNGSSCQRCDYIQGTMSVLIEGDWVLFWSTVSCDAFI